MNIVVATQALTLYQGNAGKKIIFVTNNATKSRRTYKSKFDKLGVVVNVVSPLTGNTNVIRHLRKGRTRFMDRRTQPLCISHR